jgi:hypothetical protein
MAQVGMLIQRAMREDPGSSEGASSGLSGPSLASCFNLFTVEQTSIEQVIGHIQTSSSSN